MSEDEDKEDDEVEETTERTSKDNKEKVGAIEQLDILDVIDDMHVQVDAQMFKDIFDLASVLMLDEVQIKLRPTGIIVDQMDGARVTLTQLMLPKEAFRILKPGKKVKELQLIIKDVDSVLTRLVAGDILDMSIEESGKLNLQIKGKRIRNFSIPLINPDEQVSPKPRTLFTVKIKTTIEGLQVALDDASKMVLRGSAGKMKTIFGMFSFTTKGDGSCLRVEGLTDDEQYKSGTELTKGWDIMKTESKDNEKIYMSIPIIYNIIKAVSKVTNVVLLEYATNAPLKLTAELPIKGATLCYWIAPRFPDKEDYDKVTEKRRVSVNTRE